MIGADCQLAITRQAALLTLMRKPLLIQFLKYRQESHSKLFVATNDEEISQSGSDAKMLNIMSKIIPQSMCGWLPVLPPIKEMRRCFYSLWTRACQLKLRPVQLSVDRGCVNSQLVARSEVHVSVSHSRWLLWWKWHISLSSPCLVSVQLVAEQKGEPGSGLGVRKCPTASLDFLTSDKFMLLLTFFPLRMAPCRWPIIAGPFAIVVFASL